jgi:hypothetical protein
MQEEERNKWELDSLTTRQGRYPAPVRANFPAKHAFRHLLTYPQCKHRETPSVGISRPVKPVVTCRDSQFSDFGRLQARWPVKMVKYQPILNKSTKWLFYLEPAEQRGFITT